MAQLLFDNGDIFGVGDKFATNIVHKHSSGLFYVNAIIFDSYVFSYSMQHTVWPTLYRLYDPQLEISRRCLRFNLTNITIGTLCLGFWFN